MRVIRHIFADTGNVMIPRRSNRDHTSLYGCALRDCTLPVLEQSCLHQTHLVLEF